MDTQQEFEALMQSATEQADMTRMQFISKNPDMLDVMNKGIFLEYVREEDHLYITFGEPREGMAIFIGSIVAIADPETLECISIEVLDFKKAVDSGALQGAWTRLLPFIEWQPILHVPPVVPEAFPDTDDFPHDLARDVQRELAAV